MAITYHASRVEECQHHPCCYGVTGQEGAETPLGTTPFCTFGKTPEELKRVDGVLQRTEACLADTPGRLDIRVERIAAE